MEKLELFDEDGFCFQVSFWFDEISELTDGLEKDYTKEAMYSLVHNVDEIDYDSWVHVQALLGFDISYQKYLWLDLHCGACLLELTEADIPVMRKILDTFTDEVENFYALMPVCNGTLWHMHRIPSVFAPNKEIGFALTFGTKVNRDSVLRLLRTRCAPKQWHFANDFYDGTYAITFTWPEELYI